MVRLMQWVHTFSNRRSVSGERMISTKSNRQWFLSQSSEIGFDTAEDLGQGRMLPTTSIDQYSATLAKWFGVPNNDLRLIAPNIHNFSNQDLGFMRS